MARGNLELPFIINTDMDDTTFRSAVQRNFDHIIGNLSAIGGGVEDLLGGGGVLSDIKEEIEKTDPEDSDLRDKLNEAGVGTPDGEAPATAPAIVTLTSGINYDIWVIWSTVKNNSPVSFVVERATNPNGPWTLAGETVVVPGTETDGRWQYHDTGLSLDTDYYYRVAAKDEDGQGPWSAVTGPARVNKTVGEQIADATINLAQKVSGLLPNANLAQISDPAKLANTIVTAGKLAPGSINSSDLMVANIIGAGHIAAGQILAGHIGANQVVAGHIQAGQIQTGHMTANSINGDRITGNTIHGDKVIAGTVVAKEILGREIYGYYIEGGRISGARFETNFDSEAIQGGRVVLQGGGDKDKVGFDYAVSGFWDRAGYIHAVGYGYIENYAHQIIAFVTGGGYQGAFTNTGLDVTNSIVSGGRVEGIRLVCGGSAVNPNNGQAAIYKVGNELRARDHNGVVRTLCTF